jgi:hypothetical protein
VARQYAEPEGARSSVMPPFRLLAVLAETSL